ncbi:MAG: phosphoribosylformylglycinamidine cyclo-ligase [Kiritimatiellia bacterium]
MDKKHSAYTAAGVDIDKKMKGIETIKQMVKKTVTPGVVGGIGSFGGLFQSPGADTLIVASADGVGTKLKVAAMVGRHDTVGQDIVNHCVNDILVQGATPLFFMDYIGASVFDAEIFNAVISGLCKACAENGCALLGGETAEMPGLYPIGEYDLVGTIIGQVKKDKVITGDAIQVGDVLIGLPSGGLQTNGFSLARKVIFEQEGKKPEDLVPGTQVTFADALLAVHKSFLKPITQVMNAGVNIHGMAHITGGGFYDNIPRVLPKNVDVTIDSASWEVPQIFQFIQEKGNVDREEMYRVFNMGIGFILAVDSAAVGTTLKALEAAGEQPIIIGGVNPGNKTVHVI